MANRLELAAEAAKTVGRLFKAGKTEAEILAEHGGDEAIRAALRDIREAETNAARIAGKNVDASVPGRPFTLTPETPHVTGAAAAPKAAAPAGPKTVYSTKTPDAPEIEGGLFGDRAATGRRPMQQQGQAAYEPVRQQPMQQQYMSDQPPVEKARFRQEADGSMTPLNETARKQKAAHDAAEEAKKAAESEKPDVTKAQDASAKAGTEGPKKPSSDENRNSDPSMAQVLSQNKKIEVAQAHEDRISGINAGLNKAFDDKQSVFLTKEEISAFDKLLSTQIVEGPRTIKGTDAAGNPIYLDQTDIRARLNDFLPADEYGIRRPNPELRITREDFYQEIELPSLLKQEDPVLTGKLGMAGGLDAPPLPMDDQNAIYTTLRARGQLDSTKPTQRTMVRVDDNGNLLRDSRGRFIPAGTAGEGKDAPIEAKHFDFWLRDRRNVLTGGDVFEEIVKKQAQKRPIPEVSNVISDIASKNSRIVPDLDDVKKARKILEEQGKVKPASKLSEAQREALDAQIKSPEGLNIHTIDSFLRVPGNAVPTKTFDDIVTKRATQKISGSPVTIDTKWTGKVTIPKWVGGLVAAPFVLLGAREVAIGDGNPLSVSTTEIPWWQQTIITVKTLDERKGAAIATAKQNQLTAEAEQAKADVAKADANATKSEAMDASSVTSIFSQSVNTGTEQPLAVSPRNGAQIKTNLDSIKSEYNLNDTEIDSLKNAWISATNQTVPANQEFSAVNQASPEEVQNFASQAQKILENRFNAQNSKHLVEMIIR